MSEYTQEDLARDEMAEEVIELLEEVYQGEMLNMYQFTKPDSAVALKWKYSDWCDHIDALWRKADNGSIKTKEE